MGGRAGIKPGPGLTIGICFELLIIYRITTMNINSIKDFMVTVL